MINEVYAVPLNLYDYANTLKLGRFKAQVLLHVPCRYQYLLASSTFKQTQAASSSVFELKTSRHLNVMPRSLACSPNSTTFSEIPALI